MMKSGWLAALLVLVVLAPAPAQAQAPDPVAGAEDPAAVPAVEPEPPPAPPPADALSTIPLPVTPEPLPAAGDSGPRQLDEIVVTAQKTKQSARKVPLSVTALGGEFIQATGAADLADISLYIPNVRVDADDLGSPQVFIRGFGTNSFNPSFEGSVAFVQDEIYFGRPGYFTEAMFDVERLEVLRGSQGTLFGKNTVAGVFNVTSKGADSEPGANARYFYGEDNEHRFEGGVGGLGDWAGGRVAVLYRSQDGELYNQFLDRSEDALEQGAARVKLQLVPGYGLDSELTATISETRAPFWPFQLMKLDADTRDYLEGFDPAIEDDPLDFRTSFDTPGYIEKGSETVGLKTQWLAGEAGPLQDLAAVLVAGWSQFRIDQLNELDVSPADIARLDSHEDHDQRSLELRFTGASDSLFGLGERVEFVTGGFWFESGYTLLARVLAGRDLGSYVLTCDFRQLAGAPQEGCEQAPPGLPLLGTPTAMLTDGDYYQFDYVQDIETLAFFGQMTWYLSERWAVTPGLRVNREQKRVDAKGTSYCQGRDAGQPCFMEQLLMAQDYDHRDLARKESDLSPKLALQYFAAAGVNYYASYTRGFKSGGFNAVAFSAPTRESLAYEPEKAATWETGAKGRFFDNTFGLNLALYRTRFDNLQVLAFNGVFFDVATANAKSQGLETDFDWLTPYEPLRIMGSMGLLDARYSDYDGAPAPIRNPETGELQVNATQDLDGRRIAFAPRITATMSPSLTYFFGQLKLGFAVDVLYQGDQYTDTDLDEATHVEAYTKYAARLSLGSVAGGWAIALGGTNLTDERVLNQVVDAVFFPGTYYAQQASGRQFFATLSAGF